MSILVQRKFPQRGAVLIFSLIILLVITLVSTAAMRLTTLEEKVAGNISNYDFAFQGSESALRVGERQLRGLFPRPPTQDATSGKLWIWDASDKAAPWWEKNKNNDPWWKNLEKYDSAWWENNDDGKGGGISHSYEPDKTLPGAVSELLYLIEHEGYVQDFLNWGGYENKSPRKDFYRITSRAKGGSDENDKTEVLLQSSFAWRYD